jgi:hypothetical protein
VAKRTLNDRIIKALKPARRGERYDVMDAAMPGFGVRITDRGTRTFTLVKRYPGSANPTRRALGEYPAISTTRPVTRRNVVIAPRLRIQGSFRVRRQGRPPSSMPRSVQGRASIGAYVSWASFVRRPGQLHK